MAPTFISLLLKRLGSKSPKFFKIIQYFSFGTAIAAGAMLYLSENDLIVLHNQDGWNELLKGLLYTGLGSGGTASTTTTNASLIGEEVKTNILQDKTIY